MSKIGTHNSLSYKRPQWWVIPFFWVARCQKLTLEEQYNAGVRYFDIRPKLVNGKMLVGHGLATYKMDLEEVWKFLNEKKDCIARFFFESGDSDKMVEYAKDVMARYPNIQYTGGLQRFKGRIMDLPDIPEKICYWIKKPETKFCIPFPWLYALLHNKKNKKEINDDVYSLFDFINIG